MNVIDRNEINSVKKATNKHRNYPSVLLIPLLTFQAFHLMKYVRLN